MLDERVLNVGDSSWVWLRQVMSGEVLLPGDPEYDNRRTVWNGLFNRRPAVIALCHSAGDIAKAVRFAHDHGLAVAVHGGGHHVAGYGSCDGGMLIDTSAMRAVTVLADSQEVRVECGASAGDVIRATQQHGLALPTGDVSKVGIAGLTLGGGMGYLRRKYGLTCDHLVEAEMVLADGSLIRTSRTEHPDLFWAIRGGGGNFGVVTSFTFRVIPIGPVVFALNVLYAATDLATVLEGCRTYTRQGNREVSFNIVIHTIPPHPHAPPELVGQKIIGISGMHASADLAEAERDVAPLRQLASPLADLSGPCDYTRLHTQLDERIPQGISAYVKSTYLRVLDDAALTAIATALATSEPTAMAIIWLLGGRMAEVPADDTAFGDRGQEALVIMETVAAAGAASDMGAGRRWVDQFHSTLSRQQLSPATYLNMAGFEDNPAVVVQATYGSNYDRLLHIKRLYDPDNTFRHNPNIAPE